MSTIPPWRTEPSAVFTRCKIRHAIDALRAIGLDVIRAMTDEELADFRDAMSGPWMMTESDGFRRLGRESADTQWPDAMEREA
jgi:hypothetical protein